MSKILGGYLIAGWLSMNACDIGRVLRAVACEFLFEVGDVFLGIGTLEVQRQEAAQGCGPVGACAQCQRGFNGCGPGTGAACDLFEEAHEFFEFGGE